jgi:hypothetical protein
MFCSRAPNAGECAAEPYLLLLLSQGGAVAKLVGLRLLREAPEWPPPALRVVCFATPAVGNNALAGLVEAAGWGEYFKTYVLPGGKSSSCCMAQSQSQTLEATLLHLMMV